MKHASVPFPAPTLRWLYAGLILALLPHALRLPGWITLLSALIVPWSYLAARRRLPVPPEWLRLSLALVTAFGVYVSYGRLFGRDASVAWLIILLGIKLLELNSRRDAMLVVFLTCFLVVTNFLYTQDIPTALWMGVMVLVITASLIAIHRAETPLPAALQLRVAGRMLLQALPMMLVLFVLFPRIPGPLWGLPQDAHGGVSGLSDSMTPGAISQLGLSDAVAFRVDFHGPVPPAAERYWRGPVLWAFDGRTWRMGRNLSTEAFDDFTPLGGATRYTVTLEPHNRNWLFGLEMVDQAPPNGRLLGDHQLRATRPVAQRLRYTLSSHTRYRSGEMLDENVRRAAVQLPAIGHPRLRALAAAWRAETRDDPALVQRVLRHFRQQPFVYTLNPPRLGANAMDEFFFDTRRGFCEHFTGAFVILMRAAGIPARVVTGYQGGELNPIGNYFIVRQSDAHAWAEVWLEGRGWVRIDPTAAVAPERIERGLRDAVPEGDPLPVMMRIDNVMAQRLRLFIDSLNNRWNQWILNYDDKRQADFLSRFGLGLEKWQNMVLAMTAVLGALLGLLAFFMLWRRQPEKADPAQRLYRRFCRRMERLGLARKETEGPADFARRIAASHPELAVQASRITQRYIELRYAPVTDERRFRAGLVALRQDVCRFRPRQGKHGES